MLEIPKGAVKPEHDLTTLAPRSQSVLKTRRTQWDRSSIFYGRVANVVERNAVTVSAERVVKFWSCQKKIVVRAWPNTA